MFSKKHSTVTVGKYSTVSEGIQGQSRQIVVRKWLSWCLNFLRLVRDRLVQQEFTQVASSLTFTTVLSLVPMVTVALAVFTAFPMFDQVKGNVEGYMMQGFLPEAFSETILTYINQFSEKARGLTTVGVLVLGITALMTMLTIDRAFNNIWNVNRQRSLVDKVLLYWAVLTIAPLLVGFSLTITSTLINYSMKTVGRDSVFLVPVLFLTPVITASLAFTLIFKLVPNRAVRWSDALLGGTLSAILFEGSKEAFAAYVVHFPSYTAVYGAMAAIPLFLIWIYVSWIIILLGAVVSASFPVARSGVWHTRERAGERWVLALRVLGVLYASRQNARPGLTLEQLRVNTQASPGQLDNVLLALTKKGIVGLLAGSRKREKFVLICDPDVLNVSQVAQMLWYDPKLTHVLDKELPESALRMSKLWEEYISKAKLSEWLEGLQLDNKSNKVDKQ